MYGDLTFLHGSHMPRCIATVDKRFDYFTFQLMLEGGIELSCDGQATVFAGPWMWMCYPGPRFHFTNHPAGRPWNHRYIAFTGPRASVWDAEHLLRLPPSPLEPDHAPRLAELLDELLAQFNRPGRWAHLRAVNLLERLLLERAEQADPTVRATPKWLADVMRELSRFDRDIDYAQLAAAHHMSLTTFRRRLGQAVGMSPHRYRLQCRIARARRLLGETDMPIKRIAAELGYCDEFYFTRQFAEHVGKPPATFRKSRQP